MTKTRDIALASNKVLVWPINEETKVHIKFSNICYQGCAHCCLSYVHFSESCVYESEVFLDGKI